MYRVAAYTNVGSVKESNQDSCCVEVAQTPYGDTALLAVCDGVGGLSSGEVASASVIRWLCSWYELRFSRLLQRIAHDNDGLLDMVEQDWRNGITLLNETLRLHGRNTNQRLGSTFTAMLFVGGSYIIGHVGDCRTYLVENGTLTQLTEDQTWVAREVARGTITPEQARSHPQRNVILQSVGTQEEIAPVFVRGKESKKGATYFICCDGFRNELFDDELTSAFVFEARTSEQDMKAAMEGLAQLAMQRGERDNITAVCMCASRKKDYGKPIIECEDGIATVVEPEEEALPTGFLEEQDADSVGDDSTGGSGFVQPTFQTIDSVGDKGVELISPAGVLAANAVVAGRYKVVKELSSAAVRSAWLVRDLKSHILYMLLEVPAQSEGGPFSLNVKRLLNYATIAYEADIKTLWRVEEAYQNGNSLLAICEFVQGSSLLQLIRKEEAGFAQEDVVNWGIQLCSTMAVLHAQRPPVLCADVRPVSVVLRPDGTLCVGLVQSMRRANEPWTSDDYLARGYSAPELFVDPTLADERSDVYALGASLFHLVTGHSPMEYARRLKLPPVRDVQPTICNELDEVISKATKPDADDRYQTANSMLRALQRVEAVLQQAEDAQVASDDPDINSRKAGE